jgi:hypothetical protein
MIQGKGEFAEDFRGGTASSLLPLGEGLGKKVVDSLNEARTLKAVSPKPSPGEREAAEDS